MKIDVLQKPGAGNIFFYPYWENDEIIKNLFPGYLIDKIMADKEFLSTKDSSRRYFINGQDIIVINICDKNEITLEIIRQFASVIYSISKKLILDNFNIYLFPDEWRLDYGGALQAACEGFLLTEYKYNTLKSKKGPDSKINNITFVLDKEVDKKQDILNKVKILTESIFLTRDLVNTPSNIKTIDYLEKYSIDFAKKQNIEINILKKKDLEKSGFNLLLAVGQGSAQEPEFIELNYKSKKENPAICLIGKGIVFDSGGIDLKPHDSLNTMKIDMAGAATVIGIMDAASKMALPLNITGLLPFAENAVDGKSIRPGDIITGYNKKSVEIKNTDAEGRMILADALSYSDTKKFDLVIDMATLTGGAIIALGTKITAGFFRNKDTRDKLISSSIVTGEPIWELPLYAPYKEYLKNDIADLSNIGSPPREAGTIVAALFLNEFIKNNNWVHFDIAGPAYLEENYYYQGKGATGILIRTIVHYLENY